MKKILGSAATALFLVWAGSASAQTFATTPGTYTFAGSAVQVQKGSGPLLTCALTIDIVNTAGTITATNPTLTGSGGACNTVVFLGYPWTVTNIGGAVWRIGFSTSIFVDTTITPGDCRGYLDVTYSPGPPGTDRLQLNTGFSTPSTLPADTPGTGDCKIAGVIRW
jgi:hypothetical protein